MRNQVAIAALAALLALPIYAQAQEVPGGAARGADEGGRPAGPVGAAVGGVAGGVTGGIAGILGADQRPLFHDYAIRERRSAYRVREPVAVGAVLPETGVTYYAVPSEYGVPPEYRYTVVNDRVVLVDPRTRQIVEVIE
jgi:hypothetical protein